MNKRKRARRLRSKESAEGGDFVRLTKNGKMGEDENRKGADGALAIGKFARKADAVRDRQRRGKRKQAGNLGGERQKRPFCAAQRKGNGKKAKGVRTSERKTAANAGKCGRRSGRNLCANKNARFPIGKAAVKATCFRSAREQKKNRNFCADSIDGAVFYCPREGIKKISWGAEDRKGRETSNRFCSGAAKPKKSFFKRQRLAKQRRCVFSGGKRKGGRARERLSFIHKGAWSSIE